MSDLESSNESDNESDENINKLINETSNLTINKEESKKKKSPTCGNCGQEGHINSKKKPCTLEPKKKVVIEPKEIDKDIYTEDVLRVQFTLHLDYVKQRKESGKNLKIKFRFPSIPEDISENLIKFIIHKLGDKSSKWMYKNKTGDLKSDVEGIQECKCFTSDGPLSFTPSSEWDILYFLDAINFIDNKFILYKVTLKRTSDEWKNIKMNKTESFDDQCKQKRRPRIKWESLQPQIVNYCEKVFEGSIDDIFNNEINLSDNNLTTGTDIALPDNL